VVKVTEKPARDDIFAASASNYRQRVRRADRRGEAFAAAMTFCRDLPLDWVMFLEPARLLSAPIAAPSVRLDSAGLVQRHVNAAHLGAFLRDLGGVNVKGSIGAFFGATETEDLDASRQAPADEFLVALAGAWVNDPTLARNLSALVRGTALEGRDALRLATTTADAFEALSMQWRNEHARLLARRDGAEDAATVRDAHRATRRLPARRVNEREARLGEQGVAGRRPPRPDTR
jgi:DEAD/DEAH box helicase domain-containing protein